MPNPAHIPNSILGSDNLIIDDKTTTYKETTTDTRGDTTTTIDEAPTRDFANHVSRQGR